MNVENGTPWKSTSVAVALPIRVMRTGVVGKMAEVVQGTNGGLYLADRQTRLFLGGVSTHDEVRAIGGVRHNIRRSAHLKRQSVRISSIGLSVASWRKKKRSCGSDKSAHDLGRDKSKNASILRKYGSI